MTSGWGLQARQEHCGKNAQLNLLREEVQAVKSSSNLGLVQPELHGGSGPKSGVQIRETTISAGVQKPQEPLVYKVRALQGFARPHVPPWPTFYKRASHVLICVFGGPFAKSPTTPRTPIQI